MPVPLVIPPSLLLPPSDDDDDCAPIADDDKDEDANDDEVIAVEDPAIFLSAHDSEETKGFVETDSRRCSLASTF